MKKLWRRLGALLIAAVMVLSVTVREAGTVYAAGTLPTQVTNCENSSFNGLLTLGFGDDTAATNYVKAINKVTVNDTEFTKGTFSYWGNTGTQKAQWELTVIIRLSKSATKKSHFLLRS